MVVTKLKACVLQKMIARCLRLFPHIKELTFPDHCLSLFYQQSFTKKIFSMKGRCSKTLRQDLSLKLIVQATAIKEPSKDTGWWCGTVKLRPLILLLIVVPSVLAKTVHFLIPGLLTQLFVKIKSMHAKILWEMAIVLKKLIHVNRIQNIILILLTLNPVTKSLHKFLKFSVFNIFYLYSQKMKKEPSILIFFTNVKDILILSTGHNKYFIFNII